MRPEISLLVELLARSVYERWKAGEPVPGTPSPPPQKQHDPVSEARNVADRPARGSSGGAFGCKWVQNVANGSGGRLPIDPSIYPMPQHSRASVWKLTTGASRLYLAASSPFRVSATLEQTISSTWATASKRRENVISQKRTQSTRTVADAVTVLTPLRGVAPAFKTTMSVTVLGTPACPACMVT